VRQIVVLCWCVLASACALTSKGKSVDVRYYSVGSAAPRTASPPSAGLAASPAPTQLELRLGRVEAASYIREKIAFRDSSVEVGYYETLRWTESPEAYLRRALERSFFQEQKVQELVSGAGPTLEVELSAFEEVRAPEHVARVEVTWKLRVARTVQIQRTVAVDRPIEATPAGQEKGVALAAAMARALDDAVDAVVSDVVAELLRAGNAA
jgi:cholesterol transport system auxiliary component